MTEENLFNYLVSRVHTRETSTLSVAAIASTASLILLALYFSATITDDEKNVIWWLGIILPIIGFAYFEMTFATQQSWDYDNITKLIKKNNDIKEQEINRIIFGEKRSLVLPKEIIWRVLLVLPIIGWLSLYENQKYILEIVVVIVVIIGLLVLRIELKKNKIDKVLKKKL